MHAESTFESFSASERHYGPPLLLPALSSVALFAAGLIAALGVAHGFFPTPFQSLAQKTAYFAANPGTTRAMAFLQFGSAIPLAVFAAAAASRLRFLGVSAAGPTIALAGGLAASFALAGSAAMEWMLARPGTLENPALLSAFYDLAFLLGGPMYMAGMGLLLAGVSIPAYVHGWIPRWAFALGMIVAVIAEASTVTLLTFKGSFLLPARFPAYAWMIAVAATLPTWRTRDV